MSSKLLRGLVWTGVALAGISIVNAEIARHVDPLDPAGPVDGEPGYYQWSLGRVFYTVKGQGRPVVLVYGFSIGADSSEWRHVFGTLSERFRVYAYDQLGFGLSDRPDITYNPDLYVRLQRDFLRDVVGGKSMVVASRLAAAHALVAASLYPTLYERLVLLHPSYVRGILKRPGWEWSLAHTLLRSPVLGELLVNIIASRSSIARQHGDELTLLPGKIDPAVVDACYASSHQPGARHAIASFISGFLDVDVRLAFARLTQPVTVLWGEGGQIPSGRINHFMNLNPRAQVITLEGAGSDIANERPAELVSVIESQMEGGVAAG